MKKKTVITLAILFALFLAKDIYFYISWRRTEDAYQKCIDTSTEKAHIEPIPPVCTYEDGTRVVGNKWVPSGITFFLLEKL